MGTRGAIGFRLSNKDHTAYNHFDSYPDCLGSEVVAFIQSGVERLGDLDSFIGETKQRVRSLEVVDGSEKPSESQKKWLAEYTDLSVSEQSTDDWYCLLRDTQGDMEKMLAARYHESAESFLLNGLFCEYAYIINLDDETLEFYKGFTKIGQDEINGRYGAPEIVAAVVAKHAEECKERKRKPDEKPYGPVTLVATFPLKDLVTASPETIVEQMNKLAHPETEEESEEA